MIKRYFFLVLLLLSMTSLNLCFTTLSDLQTYAANHIENPPSDDEHWYDPDFSSYHKSLRPSWWQYTLHKLGINPIKTLWSTEEFERILKMTLEQRKKANLSGRKIAYYKLSYPAHIFIVGDLEGSFHTLVRSLSWLYEQGIINENLEIIKSDYFLIFNGDAISRSAYILETFTTLLILLYRNPEKVIYTRGNHEDHQYWHNFGLKRELFIRTNTPLSETIPLGNEINDFFNTLPLAFYVSPSQEPTSLVRVSPTGLDDPEIEESLCGSFWQHAPQDSLQYYDISKHEPLTQDISVKAIIKSEDWMTDNRTVVGEPRGMFGLGHLDPDRGATAWAILSSPIMAHQKYLNFSYDAFIMLDIQATIAQSSITLYNQDIILKHGFKKHEAFNLLTGIPVSRSKTIKKEFKIGSSLSLIRGVPIMGRQIKRGMSARIREANLSEELPSLHVTLTTYNDDYTPHLARQNIERLMNKDNVDLILLPTGSPTLTAYLPLITENKILTLFPVTGGPQFFSPELTGLINYRVTYADEVRILIEHVLKNKAAKKFAFFYQDDAYGLGALEAAHAILKKHGINEWTDIPYLRGSTDFKKQAEIINQVNPDSIGFFSAALPTRELIRHVGIDNLTNKILFGVSFLGEETIRHFTKRQGINILYGAIVPNPHVSDLEIVKKYRKQMEVNNYKYDVFSLEAYICTSILIDVLKKVKDPTPDTIKKHLESLKNYEFEGLTLSFDPQRRSLSNTVWIETGDDTEWTKKNIDTQ